MTKIISRVLTAVFLLAICAVSFGCGGQLGQKGEGLRIVTSFYPVYIATANITRGVEGVSVTNMTPPQTGCLHDYQISPEDMKKLADADVFVVNGGGMENFLEKVTGAQKKLTIIDASATDKLAPIAEGDGVNPHTWLSVAQEIERVKAITSQLVTVDPKHKDEYRKNALDYVMKLEGLREDMHRELDTLPHKDIVIFHEAFPYFAREFGLNIVATIEHEPGVEPTPQELVETIEKIADMPVKVLFIEPQYPDTAARTIARETGAAIYRLDPIVTGEANEQALDDYLNKMRHNAEVLKEALGSQ